MTSLNVIHGDNLEALESLRKTGERFDLVELDGPYMAGIGESWDDLTEAEYVQHYADRLTAVRDVLQPWGVVFVFGYPECCAEIKSWAHRTGTLYLRRWISWYLNSTTHAGRKIQAILVFDLGDILLNEFRSFIKIARGAMGITIAESAIAIGVNEHIAVKNGSMGGYVWFESSTGKRPNLDQYLKLKRFFGVSDYFDPIPFQSSFNNLTNLDFITVPPENAAHLNDGSLRSKPIGLYRDLFTPTIPPTETRRALVLYGGSGNAAIAAGLLGYDVTVCEIDSARCDLIRRRWAWKVERRDETPRESLGPLFDAALADPPGA